MENQIAKTRNDFNQDELESLKGFISNGTPSISRLSESDMFKVFELYMVGKTYTEISKITNIKKDVVLYLSHKQGWFDKKMTYYSDLNDKVLEKYQQSKLESINTVTTMVSALNQYFGDKFNKFLATKDKTIIEELDTKLLAQYQKAQENMDKLMGATISSDDGDIKPLVNINMNGGTIRQTDKNTIEIESDSDEEIVKERTIGEILSSLSKIKKIRETDED